MIKEEVTVKAVTGTIVTVGSGTDSLSKDNQGQEIKLLVSDSDFANVPLAENKQANKVILFTTSARVETSRKCKLSIHSDRNRDSEVSVDYDASCGQTS